MNLHDYILGIISKKELKITREEVDDAIRLYIKAYNSNPKYKEDFIYKRITDYYAVGEIFKEEHEKVSNDVNIIVPDILNWGDYVNRVGEYNIINGKQFLQFTAYSDKFYYDEENQLLLFEDKEECRISMLRISPSVIKDVKKNKCIIRGKFILVYDDNGTIQIYSAEKGYREDISKYILNLKFINNFYGENNEWARLILKKITDNVEKNFLRVVFFMIGEKYGIKNKKEAGLEYIFKKNTPKNIKNIPKIFFENEENKEYKIIFHKGIILLFINGWLTRNSGFSEKTYEKFKKIKATNIKFIKWNINYTDHDNLKKLEGYNNRLEINNKLKIIEDINNNLKKLMNKYYDLNILEAINNDLKIISRLSKDVDFYLIDIISELKKIKKCTEKIKLEMKEEYEVRRDLEREGYYYQELNNESENDFNERDE